MWCRSIGDQLELTSETTPREVEMILYIWNLGAVLYQYARISSSDPAVRWVPELSLGAFRRSLILLGGF